MQVKSETCYVRKRTARSDFVLQKLAGMWNARPKPINFLKAKFQRMKGSQRIDFLGAQVPVLFICQAGTLLAAICGVLMGVTKDLVLTLPLAVTERIPPDVINTSLSLMWLAGIILGTIMSFARDNALESFETLTKQRDALQALVSNSEMSFYETINQTLCQILDELKVNKHANRVTLFSPSQDGFFKLGRWCENPNFRTRGEDVVPKLGVVQGAWEKGKFFDNSVPEHNGNGAAIQHHIDKHSYTKEQAEGLRMKSRCYAGYVIKSRANKEIGVVVFESELPDVFTDKNLKRKKISNHLQRISTTMESLEPHAPNPDKARECGF
jgi:hypothetical protein